MTPLLSARDLCIIRGDRCLVRGLSFALTGGELLLIEGANGSGKTSLLRAITGLLPLEEGTVSWAGEPVAGDPQRFRAALAWFAHRTGFKNDLNLMANLKFEFSLRPRSAVDLSQVLDQLGLQRLVALPFRVLSAGQQRRVALARMLLSDCPLWIMDEPLTNLDTNGRALVESVIAGHLGAGGMCIVASHQTLQVAGKTQRIQL